MICAGNTFLIKTCPDYTTEHLYIVIAIDNGKVLLVNITSSSFDKACSLKRDDHPFITHKSYINYRETLLSDVSSIEEAISKDAIKPHEDISSDLLKKIQDGAKISPK